MKYIKLFEKLVLDDILDKMNSTGFDSLTKYEKDFLKTYGGGKSELTEYDIKKPTQINNIVEVDEKYIISELLKHKISIEDLIAQFKRYNRLPSFGLSDNIYDDFISYWNEHNSYINICFINFKINEVVGVSVNENIIIVNKTSLGRLPMPLVFLILLHESQHCKQRKTVKSDKELFDNYENEEESMKFINDTEIDANNYALDVMKNELNCKIDSRILNDFTSNIQHTKQVYDRIVNDIKRFHAKSLLDLFYKQLVK
jgi:hypothetical protein